MIVYLIDSKTWKQYASSVLISYHFVYQDCNDDVRGEEGEQVEGEGAQEQLEKGQTLGEMANNIGFHSAQHKSCNKNDKDES